MSVGVRSLKLYSSPKKSGTHTKRHLGTLSCHQCLCQSWQKRSVVAKWPGAIRRPSDTNHDGNDVQASTSNRQSCVLVQSTATRWCERLNHKSIVISRPTSPCLTEGAPGVVTAEDPVLRFVRGLGRSLVRTESRPLAVASDKHKSKRYHVIL